MRHPLGHWGRTFAAAPDPSLPTETERDLRTRSAAEKSTEIVLTASKPLPHRRSGPSTREEIGFTKASRSGIWRMVDFHPPGEGVEIRFRRQDDLVDDTSPRILKLHRVEPVPRMFLDRDKGAGPIREKKLQVAGAAAGAYAARRAHDLGIVSHRAQNCAAVSAKGNHRTEGLQTTEEHRPARQERNQDALVLEACTCTNVSRQQRTGSKDRFAKRPRLILRNSGIHGSYFPARIPRCLTVRCQKFVETCGGPKLDLCATRTQLRSMLISQALNDKINEQIGYEFAASIQYTAIASHFDAESLPFWRSTFTNRQTRRMNTPRSSLNFY